jgi:SepF-like predicted cell division protein (DUF552 family)
MPLKDLLKKIGRREEYEELKFEEEAPVKVGIRIETLSGLIDIDRLSKLLREGNILFVKSKELQRKDLGQFEQAVHKLKRICRNYGFDIVGTEDGYLVLTPKFAKIVR